jgi:hypothetical protein
MRQRTIHFTKEYYSMNGVEYVVNSETKLDDRHGHWRCCYNGHEAGVQT